MKFLQEQRRHVREREKSPFTYEFKDEDVHHCINCFHDFTGNYCPYCSQAAGTSRITWKSIFESFLDLWDFTTRSVPSTLWQLLYRPGYLIRDYLRGQRLASFPPIKMLLVIALFTGLIDHFFIPEEEIENPKTEVQVADKATGMEEKEVDYDELIDIADAWARSNQGWARLMVCSFMILPTWLLFRRSKRFPRHTMPEGFYLQVFVSPLMLIIALLNEVHDIFYILFPLYYFYCYRQLFGYGFWGTLWRLLICFLFFFIAFVLTVLIVLTIIVIIRNH